MNRRSQGTRETDSPPNDDNTINDANVYYKLIDARVHNNEREIKKCEQFLCFQSQKTQEEKQHIALFCGLEKLKIQYTPPELQQAVPQHCTASQLPIRQPLFMIHQSGSLDMELTLRNQMDAVAESATQFWLNPRTSTPLTLIHPSDELPSTMLQSTSTSPSTSSSGPSTSSQPSSSEPSPTDADSAALQKDVYDDVVFRRPHPPNR